MDFGVEKDLDGLASTPLTFPIREVVSVLYW